MCITDHPAATCADKTGAVQGGGLNMTGNEGTDLTTLIKNGGITLVRDMKRADQFLSYPCAGVQPWLGGTTASLGCVKTDLLASNCVEGLIPLAELIINGPTPVVAASPSAGATASPATSPAGTPPTPAGGAGNATATPSGGDPPPAKDPVTTSSPAIGTESSDDGLVTTLAKNDIIAIRLQSQDVQAACGGFVQAKMANIASTGAGIIMFLGTLGVHVPIP